MNDGKYSVVDFANPPEIKEVTLNELTKRQKKTIKSIGRWADGCCTHSKAKKTNQQLKDLYLVDFVGDAVVLTKEGRKLYNEIDT